MTLSSSSYETPEPEALKGESTLASGGEAGSLYWNKSNLDDIYSRFSAFNKGYELTKVSPLVGSVIEPPSAFLADIGF